MSTDSAINAQQSSSFNRVPLLLALFLAITLVIVVLVGSKVVYERAARQPVAMSVVDSPDADSPECAELVGALPEELAGHPRAELAEPAPAGAAAWASNSAEQITLRCGVNVPLQFTTLSTTVSAEGSEWLQVKDSTPGSDLQTWYSVDRQPVVAITTADSSDTPPVTGLGSALASFNQVSGAAHPAPLSALEATDSEFCAPLAAALPKELGSHVRIDAAAAARAGLPEDAAAWVADGEEPVVLRCGVDAPPSYAPGAQLQQVNDIPWFQETTLASGTTAGTWFALGRKAQVAVSMPQSVGNAAIVELSAVISANVPVE